MKTIAELKAEIKALLDEARKINALCETEKRGFNDDEGSKIDEILAKVEEIRAEIDRLEALEARKNKLAKLDDELNQPEKRETKPSEAQITTEKAEF